MRKFLLIIALTFCAAFASAQDTTRVYCELQQYNSLTGGLSTYVDLGLEKSSISGTYTALLDDNGNKFVSKIAAVNHLCNKGWTVFTFIGGNETDKDRVIFYKDITDKRQITEGLNIKIKN